MNAASAAAKRTLAPVPTAESPVREWIDALATGSCTNVEFLRHFRELGRDDTEILWETLGLLDQVFRSRRIDRDLYLPIKTNLQQFALGRTDIEDPAPRVNVPTLEPLTPAETPTSRILATTATASTTPAPHGATPAAATQAQSAPVPIRIGMVLRGRYRIIGMLGSGASGTVVEAIDEMRADAPDISQRIAIRIFETRTLEDAGQLASYLRHVCRLQTFSHPHLMRVFDFDQDQGRSFLTMELLAGASLPQVIAKTASSLRITLDGPHVLRCVASAILYAHSHGVAHGRLRAEEVFITHEGDVRVLGFDRAFQESADGHAKDHSAFAWLAYDLLSGGLRTEPLLRPDACTDAQWRLLEAVIDGDDAAGPLLLQQFASPAAAAIATPAATTVPTPSASATAARGSVTHAHANTGASADAVTLTDTTEKRDEAFAISAVAAPPEMLGGNPFGDSSGRSSKAVWSALALVLVAGGAYLAYERFGTDLPFLRDTGSPAPAAAATRVPAGAETIDAADSPARTNTKASTGTSAGPGTDNTTATNTAESPPGTPSPETSLEAAPVASAALSGASLPAPGERPAFTGRTSTIDLSREAVEIRDDQTVARVRVQRRGNLGKAVEFVWWTETGSAQPGIDFNAVSPRTASFPAGVAYAELFIPLVPDAVHTQPRTFYVKIDEASDGATLGERTLAQVSIIPVGYVAPPEAADAAPTETSPTETSPTETAAN